MANGIKDLASRADTALDKATDYSNSLLALGVALNPATSTLQDVFDIGLGGINTLRSLFKGEGIPGEEVARSGFGILGLLPIISGVATRQGRQALSDLMKRVPEEDAKDLIKQLNDPALADVPIAETLMSFEPKLLTPISSSPHSSVLGKNTLLQGYPTGKLADPEILTDAIKKLSHESQDVGLGRRELNPLRGQDEKDDLVKIWLRDDKRKEIETALGWKWLPDGNEFVNLKTGALQKNIPEELLNNPEWRAIRDRFAKDRNKIEEAMEEGRRRGAIDPSQPRYVSPEDQARIAVAKDEAREVAEKSKIKIDEKKTIRLDPSELRDTAHGPKLPPLKEVEKKLGWEWRPNENQFMNLKTGKTQKDIPKELLNNREWQLVSKKNYVTLPEKETLKLPGESQLPQVKSSKAKLTELTSEEKALALARFGRTPMGRTFDPSYRTTATASENPAAYANKMLNELVDDTIDTASHRGFSLEDIADIERSRVTVGGIKFTEDLGNPKVVQMNYKDGARGLNMQPQFKGKSTLDLIKSGDRTGTSRASINKNYKVGDLVEFEGRNKEKILVKIEAHADGSVWKKLSDIDPEEWMASEGWDLQAYDRLAREGNYQMKYSVAKPGQQGERVFGAEGITRINDALKRIHQAGEESIGFEAFLKKFQTKPLGEQKRLLKKFMSDAPDSTTSDLGYRGPPTQRQLSKQEQLDIDRISKEKADAKVAETKYNQTITDRRNLHQRVATAMKDSLGDQNEAARALNMTTKELEDIIRQIQARKGK